MKVYSIHSPYGNCQVRSFLQVFKQGETILFNCLTGQTSHTTRKEAANVLRYARLKSAVSMTRP